MDLSKFPFFELSEGDRVEVFINGRSRLVSPGISGNCRLYIVFVSDNPAEEVDDLPF